MGRKSPNSKQCDFHGAEGHNTVCDGQMQRLKTAEAPCTSRQCPLKGRAMAQRNGSIANTLEVLQQVNRYQQRSGNQVISFFCFVHPSVLSLAICTCASWQYIAKAA